MSKLFKHYIELPKKVIVGHGVIDEVGRIVKELVKGNKIFMVTGPHVYDIVGKHVIDELYRDEYDVEVSKVRASTIDVANEVLEYAGKFKPDIIIGLGGGKSIDIAKYIAAKLNIQFISIPTAASHDGVASPFVSLRGTGRLTSVKAKPPIAIIADVDIIASAPKRLLLAGAGDLIGKFTAVLDWRLAHRLKGEYYGEYAASLSLLSAKHVLAFSDVISRGGSEAARIVIEGLISSSTAMCIAGSTRPASGSEHLFSHALDLIANYPALHGEQVALGTIMMTYLHGRKWKRIKSIIKRLGLPTTAKELGVKDVDIIKALTIAHKIRPERYTILGETGLTWEAAEKLAKVTGVID